MTEEIPEPALPDVGQTPLTMIGPLALECSESITEAFGPDAKVTTVAIVVEVFSQGENSLGHAINTIEYICSDPRRWVQQALLQEATNRATERNEDRVQEAAEAGEAPSDD
jgi:hypothetical protein